jgi:uncharacterized membrane protein YedE/YeeE
MPEFLQGVFEEPSSWLIAGGLSLGLIFGLVYRHFRFCMVAAISNIALIRDYRYAIGFAVAIMVAVTGVQIMEMQDIVAIDTSSYRDTNFDWLSALVGGLLFGFGATIAGGDAARVVVMAGQGKLAGWIIVLFFALFAYVAQFTLEGFRDKVRTSTSITLGVLQQSEVRQESPEMTDDAGMAAELQTDPQSIQEATTVPERKMGVKDAGLAEQLRIAKWVPFIVLDVLLLLFIVLKWRRHAEIGMVIGGVVLGLCIVGAWYTSGVLAYDDFASVHKVSGFTLSGPMNRLGALIVEGIVPDWTLAISFAVGLFVASVLYTVISSIKNRSLPFESIRLSMIPGLVIGGILMGLGAIFGYGCNIGQGFTGFSTLSIESIITVVMMITGVLLGNLFWKLVKK